MKFSIVVPTYNRSKIIPLCLDSLISQSYPKDKYEIIIVDNNSTDDTKIKVRNYIEKYSTFDIKYFFEIRKGSGYARNLGVQMSSYDIIAFTDDDAILEKNWLKELAAAFEKNTNTVALAGKIRIKWDKEPPSWIYKYEVFLGKLDYGISPFYKENLYINLGNFIIKKKILIELGGVSQGITGLQLIEHSEDGINKKLKDNNFIIGWVPDAIMDHYQIVSERATICDIKRRYRNLGIAIPYRLFFVEKKGYFHLFLNLFKRIKAIIKYGCLVIYYIAPSSFLKRIDAIFQISFNSSQVAYTLKIITNKKFRKHLQNADWEITKMFYEKTELDNQRKA